MIVPRLLIQRFIILNLIFYGWIDSKVILVQYAPNNHKICYSYNAVIIFAWTVQLNYSQLHTNNIFNVKFALCKHFSISKQSTACLL